MRSRFWRLDPSAHGAAGVSGAQSIDRDGSPWTIHLPSLLELPGRDVVDEHRLPHRDIGADHVGDGHRFVRVADPTLDGVRKVREPRLQSYIPMSTTWASKIPRIFSPTSSYIACISISLASPCCTSLMIASSAARSSVSVNSRLVSPNSRAFSSATPMLEAIVAEQPLVRLAEPRPFRPPTRSTPSTRSPHRIGTPNQDCARRPRRRSPPIASSSPSDPRRSGRSTGRPSRSCRPERDVGVQEALPRVDARTATPPMSVAGHTSRSTSAGTSKIAANPLAHELADRIELELRARAPGRTRSRRPARRCAGASPRSLALEPGQSPMCRPTYVSRSASPSR